MTRVETYISINSNDIKSILSAHDKSGIQGQNILLGYETYEKNELEAFFSFVIYDVNKIVVEKGIKKYFLVAQRVDDESEEPFQDLVDIHLNLKGDVTAIVEFICGKIV